MLTLTVNGQQKQVDAENDTPLLWVIREHLQMTGTKFGCGAGLCGACTVHLDGTAARSCQTAAKDAVGKKITTIEGLTVGGKPHPLQVAWEAEQVPQCGYCLNGWIMTSVALLDKTPRPSDAQIRDALTGLKCRCGTHVSILRAVKRAAQA